MLVVVSYLFAAVIGLHGAVHGLGFVSSFRLGRGVPLMSPTLLRVDPDGLLARGLGRNDAKVGALVDVAIIAGLLWTWIRP